MSFFQHSTHLTKNNKKNGRIKINQLLSNGHKQQQQRKHGSRSTLGSSYENINEDYGLDINNDDSDDEFSDDDSYDNSCDEISGLGKAVSFLVFAILLVLCLDTVMDIRTVPEKAKETISSTWNGVRGQYNMNVNTQSETSTTISGMENNKNENGETNEIDEEQSSTLSSNSFSFFSSLKNKKEKANKEDLFALEDYFQISNDGKIVDMKDVYYPKGGAAICILTTNTDKDIGDLKLALRSLIFLRRDASSEYKAPVLIFNEGDLSEKQKNDLIQSLSNSPRPISFPIVDFKDYPDGFTPETMGVKFVVKGRPNPWGYHQMIRFWISRIWLHEAIEPYEYIMRMDSDSCFKQHNDFLPGTRNEDIVYHSQFVGVENRKEFTSGLIEHSEKFLERYDKSAGNPMMWRYVQSIWKNEGTLPLLNTNFEVSRKSFMQKNIVKRWHESLTEEKPFGVFTHRWGDAVTRFLMCAMLTMNYEVDTSYPDGYGHKEQCLEEEVDATIQDFEKFLSESH